MRQQVRKVTKPHGTGEPPEHIGEVLDRADADDPAAAEDCERARRALAELVVIRE
jgi:hypothetical protein